MSQIFIKSDLERRQWTKTDASEILSNAGVALLWEDCRILNPRVSSCLDVADDGLTTTAVASIAVWPVLRHSFIVVHTLAVVLLARGASRNHAIAGCI